jgi:prepilin-type N-terminal cleavage/methylation domain-containing protein
MRPSGGFTLIELMASLAITALLATGTLLVVANLAADQATAQRAGESASPDDLQAMLELDLRQARHYRTTAGGFELHTYTCIEGDPSRLRRLPVLVRYEAAGGETGPSCLLRIQSFDKQPPRRDLVACGVKDIYIGRPRKDGDRPAVTGSWISLGASETITVARDNGTRRPLTLGRD